MLVELRPMTPAQFEAYIDESTSKYAAEKVQAGNWKEEDAADLARAEFDKYFPEGLATPDQYIFYVMDGDTEIGYLWINEQQHKKVVWIFDIEVHKQHRRKGYATAIFTALEKFIRDNLESTRIELHVFGHNDGARALYKKLGFAEMNVIMGKDID